MDEKVLIMNVPINKVTMEEASDKVVGYLLGKGQHTVFTPNPEIIMEAQEDAELMRILKQADLVVADGIGVVIASRILKVKRLPERVGGFDLMQHVLGKIKDKDVKIYFLGSKPGVAEAAAQNMREKYPGIKIVGARDGYFTKEDELGIIKEIKELEVDLLMAGLGAPRQEIWIDEHIKELGIKVGVGVGGSLDVMAGTVKRAPEIYQKLGLEWFYRLITNPKRAKRMINLPIFGFKVILMRIKGQ
ncbi:MAG TPA: WecB/TagA/CpsF family glycosyltransferase [Epulopiscium sp.]|nr:WecB/TagA/CpsF family glycosyltransferase [Candidatus Epulonipiscium sp.]